MSQTEELLRVISPAGEVRFFSRFMVEQTSVMKTYGWKLAPLDKPKNPNEEETDKKKK